MKSNEDYIRSIEMSPVYDVAIKTPIQALYKLSKNLNNDIFLKREDLQPVRSFKLRGAYHKMFFLSTSEKEAGVVAVSAGNHAQGVAMSANHLGIDAIIVMPTTTPKIKIEGVEQFGVSVLLHGITYDEAAAKAFELASDQNRTIIHPYDDCDVIAGQGTIGKEIIQDLPNVDTVFVAVGGGGLISGVALYLKSKNPTIKIIAVESEDSACLKAALDANERVILPRVGIFADGVAVKQIGKETFRIAKDLVDSVITVTTDEICAAIKDIYDDCRSIAEPAGALGIAGLKKYLHSEPDIKSSTLLALNCGGNINFDRLRHVAERAEVGEGNEVVFGVTIPEEPGSFLKFCNLIGSRHITEFNYRYRTKEEAHVFVGISISESKERYELLDMLISSGFPTVDLTKNELAILHVRHMVGGVTSNLTNESVFRFQFPECPGALLHFLNSMGDTWNISLFHYRNHGAAYGRVLVGFEIPSEESASFYQFLNRLGFTYFDESDNPAYTLFL